MVPVGYAGKSLNATVSPSGHQVELQYSEINKELNNMQLGPGGPLSCRVQL